MALKEELEKKVSEILREAWSERDGQKVPDPDDLKLGNDAVKIKGTVLYADMSDSTKLVDTKPDYVAAEIYKVYLHCASKIISSEGGSITAYDGDRIMAVFIGDFRNSRATRAALKINGARIKIINPAIANSYMNKGEDCWKVEHTIGVDASDLFVARTGIRGSNDLVWVGSAANHAAKLCNLPKTHPIRITSAVYKMINDSAKYGGDLQENMWEQVTWNEKKRTIYRSNWHWSL